MYKVFGTTASGNCYKVKLALTQLGLPFEWVETDVLKAETRQPAFLAMNPNGKVPVLQINATTFLPESNAILYYLALGTDLFPTPRLEQAQVMQWLNFEQYSHEPCVAVARFICYFLKRPAAREQELQAVIRQSYSALDVMERHLGRNVFFCRQPLLHRRYCPVCLHACCPRRSGQPGQLSGDTGMASAGEATAPAY